MTEQKKRRAGIWLLILLLIAAAFLLPSHIEADAADENQGLKVHFLDVGQGDCTLIESQGHAMLIDAGNNDKGTYVQNYLQKQGITKLDYAVGTHPDADHIGGLDVILTKFECDLLLMPDRKNHTRTYDDVVQAVRQKRVKRSAPEAGTVYTLGDASFTITAPIGNDYGNNNNDYSIGILLQYGEKRFLFTGDAEEASEYDMTEGGLDLHADVYKAAHHGSRSASTEGFMNAVNPEYAVISCGEGNSYGHPHAEVLNRFRQMGIQVYRTDEQGTIIAESDGQTITWNCQPSDSWQAGEQVTSDQEKKSTADSKKEKKSDKKEIGKKKYVLNTNTKKFHKESCKSVDTISAKNKKEVKEDRKELTEEGYSPCRRCSP